MILERARYDFRGARAPAIYQDDNWEIVPGPFLLGKIFLLLRFDPAFGVDNETGLQEHITDAHSLGQKPTGIIAQVQNQTFYPALFCSHLFQRTLHIAVATLLKLREPDVTVTRL